MNEELKPVTLKMPAAELEALQAYLMEHDIDNRSDFIREAIRSRIDGASETNGTGEDGIYVRLNGVQLCAIENLCRDGTIFDAESYIRGLVERDLIPVEAVQDSKLRAFKAAQQAARNQRTGQLVRRDGPRLGIGAGNCRHLVPIMHAKGIRG